MFGEDQTHRKINDDNLNGDIISNRSSSCSNSSSHVSLLVRHIEPATEDVVKEKDCVRRRVGGRLKPVSVANAA